MVRTLQDTEHALFPVSEALQDLVMAGVITRRCALPYKIHDSL